MKTVSFYTQLIKSVRDSFETIKDHRRLSKVNIPLAGAASKQARLAADHISGKQKKYNGTQGTAIIRVFDKSKSKFIYLNLFLTFY